MANNTFLGGSYSLPNINDPSSFIYATPTRKLTISRLINQSKLMIQILTTQEKMKVYLLSSVKLLHFIVNIENLPNLVTFSNVY